MNDRDILFAISSSGNSKNIENAILQAKKSGVTSISLSGFDGGIISEISDISVVTKSDIGQYGPVEDVHSMICHYLAFEIRKL